jgi:hypothetical protein
MAVLGANWAIDDIVTTLGVVAMGAVLLVASKRRPATVRVTRELPKR